MTNLSAWLESYRSPLKASFAAAVRDGFTHSSLSTLRPDFQPRDFNPSAQRHLLRHVRDVGLQLDGLTAAYADTGLANPARAEARLEHLLETLRLTRDLGLGRCHLATGGLDLESPNGLVHEALAQAAEVADGYGVRLALHATGDATRTAAQYVQQMRCPAVGISLDTADLDLPTRGPQNWIAEVLVRDVRQVGNRVEEVGYGSGQVDFSQLLGVLEASDYAGSLTLRRDAADTPSNALQQGHAYLRTLLNERAMRP